MSASKRDFNGMAKLKQTLSDSAAHVELAIRYWATKPEDFHQWAQSCFEPPPPMKMRGFLNI